MAIFTSVRTNGLVGSSTPDLKMYYDLELTLLGQLGFFGPVTTVYMVQIYVPEYLRSHPSEIDENQHCKFKTEIAYKQLIAIADWLSLLLFGLSDSRLTRMYESFPEVGLVARVICHQSQMYYK